MKLEKSKLPIIYNIVILVLQVAAVVLICFPVFGATFAPAPYQRVVEYYAGFSPMLWGYGVFPPIIMCLVLLITIGLLVTLLIVKSAKDKRKFTKILIMLQVCNIVLFSLVAIQLGIIKPYYVITLPVITLCTIALLIQYFKCQKVKCIN